MEKPKRLLWTSCLLLVMTHSQLQHVHGSIPSLGMNWGALASHPMDPDTVVRMFKDNGIKKVKLFDSDYRIVQAFEATNIEVMVGIPNDQLSKLADSSWDAEDWVKENLTEQIRNVNIRDVVVGNEAFLKSYHGSHLRTLFPAMQNVQRAIEKAGLGDKVKVTTAMNADVYESSTDKPSDGQFRSDISDVMKLIVRFLHDKSSSFLVNIYPFLSLYQNENFPEDLAFFDNSAKTIDDNGATYTNVFDANLDTLVHSLKKLGYPDLKIKVGEVGWPTDGDKRATPSKAQRFYNGLLRKMAAQKGTPLLPGPMDMYLFSLLDENLKSIDPGNFERHWGIFRYDGQAKFPIDFSGQGRDTWPVSAKGVKYQESRWCVVDPDADNLTQVEEWLEYACQGADCTSIGYGCSCGGLDLRGNASYAFNQYYQTRDQSADACDFEGLGEIVKDDPSDGNCLFILEIQRSAVSATPTPSPLSIIILFFSFFLVTSLSH